MYKNFQIFKNTKKQEGSKQPDFLITAKVGEKFEEVGAVWWKQDTKGNWYQSCQFKDLPAPKEDVVVTAKDLDGRPF